MDERGLNLRDTSSITEYLGNWLWNSLDLGYTSVDIDDLMRFIGELCNSERAYVFEIDEANGTISNTYEWWPSESLLKKICCKMKVYFLWKVGLNYLSKSNP